jgi:hypothetical protein
MTKVTKKAQTGKSIKDSASYNTPSAWADMHGFKTDRQMDSTLKADAAKAKAKAKVAAKSKVKAKDGKWIQKAVNPKHKGYCTPMTKATCTPKRKALAKTFKAMGKARKGK